MPKTHSVTTYGIEELGGKAREKAVEEMTRLAHEDPFLYDAWRESCESDLEAMGFELVEVARGRKAFYFSVSGVQGDGVGWEGVVDLRALLRWVASEPDFEEYKNADDARVAAAFLERVEKHLGADFRVRTTVHHVSLGDVLWLDAYGEQSEESKLDEELLDWVEGWLERVAKAMEKAAWEEYEYQTSEEELVERATANEVQFLADGRIYTGP